jgi:copper homeostasis protein CutC
VEDTGLADDWVDESELEMLDRAKLISLRFLTHRAIGYARASDRFEILDPVIELLNRILTQDGQQSSMTNEG